MLNAFRHQRGLHELVPKEKVQTENVLNAFRHQRGLHTGPRFDQVEKTLCSTPFGIKEGYTDANGGHLVRLFGVLNAFRHQRGLHQDESLLRYRCTIVLNAFRHQRGLH